jgi:hypothetical protein
LATVRYVNLNNAHPTPPYTNWATAAVDIQDAVDAAAAGDQIVVTNDIYAGESWEDPYGESDCVVVDKPLTLQSVNGPDVTLIDGGGAVRCLYLTNNAVLTGFTLTNGSAEQGGGVYCESTSAVLTNCILTGNWAELNGGGAYGGTLNNCTLTGNTATGWAGNNNPGEEPPFSGGFGGGAYSTTLNNCTLTGNSSPWGGGACSCTLNNCTLTGNWAPGNGWNPGYGGGALDSTLNNCTLTGNWSTFGGGAGLCTLNNCIVYFNTATNSVNYDLSSTLNYCCTTPLPTNGVGNISADPQLASSSHLSALSPLHRGGKRGLRHRQRH